jgi:hypothetical protein
MGPHSIEGPEHVLQLLYLKLGGRYLSLVDDIDCERKV